MPGEKNTFARILVPFFVVVLAIGVIVAIGINTSRSNQSAPAAASPSTATSAAPDEPDDSSPAVDSIAASPAQPDPGTVQEPVEELAAEPTAAELAEEIPSATAGPIPTDGFSGLRARVVDQSAPLTPIGDIDETSDSFMKIEFAPAGAGVDAITLSRYYVDIERTEHYAVQKLTKFTPATGAAVSVVSLASRAVIINGSIVDLYSTTRGPIWRQTGVGAFEAVVETEAGDTIAKITKHYSLEPNSYNIRIEQKLENLTDKPMTIEWLQYGPVDLPLATAGYGGDPRRVRFGYLLNKERDPSQQFVQTERKLHRRSSILNKPVDKFGRIWPNEDAEQNGWTLVWTAMTNRYFTFVVHPLVDEKKIAAGQPIDKAFRLAEGRIDRVVVGGLDSTGTPSQVIVLQMRSKPIDVAPKGSVDLSFSAYTGPKWRKTLGKNPIYTSLSMDKLLVFNFGGPCAFCTFQWLSHGMLRFLGFFHDVLLHDWALGIMFLVVCVRGLLHPVTKRSQISLQRFGKQMQELGPKQKKIQEKFKDDPKRQKEELAKLMREEGVNFAGALGCLPMFLQSPVWIALYAMLFFAFDLRHQPGFFGVFQAISGGHWRFLQDLSAPDAFISFGKTAFSLPLFGSVTSFNVLPILLGLVFFVHQKYMSPPPSPTTTPEQIKQQKFMRLITVVLFPVMMYNAPSGLSLYFITNSSMGILESRYIRAHIDKLDRMKKDLPPPERKKVRNVRDRSKPASFKKRKK